MSRRYYSSSAADTTLASSITAGATSITVAATTGFPVQYPYTLVLDPDTASEEVVTVTAGTGTTLTVSRGQDGTTALSHTSGAKVRHGVSARDFDEPNSHINSSTGVHGLAGAVVGTTDAQSVTNQNMTDPSNTFPPANTIPTGTVLPYGGTAAPSGWLLADGSAVSRTTYAALFAVLSTSHGAGDGSTTFNLPDLRGRAIVGHGTGSGLTARTRGQTGGSENAIVVTHSHSHSHTASSSSGTVSNDHTHGFSGSTGTESVNHQHALPLGDKAVQSGTGATVQQYNAGYLQTSNIENAAHAHSFSGSTGGISANHTHSISTTVNSDATSAGSSGTGANMPPFVVLNHIVKV